MTDIRPKVMAQPEADRLEYAIELLEELIPPHHARQVIAYMGAYKLTDQQARLLYALNLRAGKVVTRLEALTAVYGEDAGTYLSLRVMLMKLRRKLPPEAIIETIHGVGYRLRNPLSV